MYTAQLGTKISRSFVGPQMDLIPSSDYKLETTYQCRKPFDLVAGFGGPVDIDAADSGLQRISNFLCFWNLFV